MRKTGLLFNNTRMLLATGLALIVVLSGCSAPDVMAIKLVYEKADFSVNALGIEEIRIKARNMPVKVTSSDVDDIAIHYYTCEEDPYEVSLDGSTLTLKYLNRLSSLLFLMGRFEDKHAGVEHFTLAAGDD